MLSALLFKFSLKNSCPEEGGTFVNISIINSSNIFSVTIKRKFEVFPQVETLKTILQVNKAVKLAKSIRLVLYMEMSVTYLPMVLQF